MSTALDIEMAAAVLEILDDLGVPATITTTTTGGYDTATGLLSNTVVATPILKVSPPITYEGHEIDGTLVLADDFKVIVKYDVAIDVKPADDILINGLSAEIKRVDPMYSGEDVAAWMLHCAKGVKI